MEQLAYERLMTFIDGLSVAALVLIILFLVFVFFRRRKQDKK